MAELEDFKVNTKLRLSALWTSLTLLYLYGDYFELYVPHKLEGMLGGTSMLDTPMKLFLASVMLAVPAVMVFLSIALKPVPSRLLNIVFGIFFTLIMVLIAVTSLTPWRAFYVFLAVVESVVSFTIVWVAWRWPRGHES